MSFRLRLVTRAGDGREIVRESMVDGDRVTIGRASDCDIVVPDLAVAPHHAVIVRVAERSLRIVAETAAPVLLDGQAVPEGEIDPARGGEIAVGGLRIAVAIEGDAPVLTVRHRDGAAIDPQAAERAFALAAVLPGKRPLAWGLALAVLALFLAWPVWHFFAGAPPAAVQADRSWSPGPLSAAHHALEGKCTACHVQAFVSVRDNACTTCHKDVHDHADPRRLAAARGSPGFGGAILASVRSAFQKPPRGACVDCHTEHEGAGAMPPTRQAFCADCHGGLTARLADARIGDAGDFGTRHPVFRPVVQTAPGGAVTRITEGPGLREANGLRFPHALHLNPRGGVARMAQTLGRASGGGGLDCAACHRPTADGARFLPVSMERDCQGCHSLGFDRVGGTVRTLRHGDVAQMIADLRASYRRGGDRAPLPGLARHRPGASVYGADFGTAANRYGNAEGVIRAVFARGGACADCHIVIPPGKQGNATWSVAPVRQPMRYLRHGWFDHAAHRTETCGSCHAAAQSQAASDVLIPGIATCRTCHGGEGSRAPVPSSCAMCHSYHTRQDAPWRSRQRLSPAAAPIAPRSTRPPA